MVVAGLHAHAHALHRLLLHKLQPAAPNSADTISDADDPTADVATAHARIHPVSESARALLYVKHFVAVYGSK
jgi:hypothetical protein